MVDPCSCPALLVSRQSHSRAERFKYTTPRGRRCTDTDERLRRLPCVLLDAVCALAGKSLIPLSSVSYRPYPHLVIVAPFPVLCGGDGLTRPPARLELPEPRLSPDGNRRFWPAPQPLALTSQLCPLLAVRACPSALAPSWRPAAASLACFPRQDASTRSDCRRQTGRSREKERERVGIGWSGRVVVFKYTTPRGRRCTDTDERLRRLPCVLLDAVCALAGKSLIPLSSVSYRPYPHLVIVAPFPVLCGGDGLTRPPARLELPEPRLSPDGNRRFWPAPQPLALTSQLCPLLAVRACPSALAPSWRPAAASLACFPRRQITPNGDLYCNGG